MRISGSPVARVLALVISTANAQPNAAEDSYPVRPVRMVVPFTPGALNDFIGRGVAAKLTEYWGQQVVVDNRAGGNTTIGTDIAAKSPADGYTLVVLSIIHAINPSVHPKMPYDLLRDFAPVTLMCTSPFVLIVHPSLPARHLREFIAVAKAKPGTLAYGSSGTGGAQHLMGAMLAMMAGVQLLHVPYKGGAPMLTDVMGGQLQFTFLSHATTSQHVKAGRVRALAVTSAKRYAAAPELPPIADDYPGYDATPWWSLAVPAATAKPLIARLHRDATRALRSADLHERFSAQGLDIIAGTPQQANAHLREEIARWAKVVKAASIRPD